MQEMVYKQKIGNSDELRERIVESWDHLDQSIIALDFRLVLEKGGHTEHKLWLLFKYLLSNFCFNTMRNKCGCFFLNTVYYYTRTFVLA